MGVSLDLLSWMRTFVAAVETGSLTAAGRKLGQSPALSSKYLSKLEEHLGVRLMHRTTRALKLTEEGEVYASRARTLLTELDELEEALAARQSEPKGTLRVAGPRAFGVDRLSDAVAEFMKTYPQVMVELDLHERMVDVVTEGYDLAIRITALEDSSYIARRIARYPYHVVAHKDYLANRGLPQHPNDLRHHDCINLTAITPTAQWRFQDKGKPFTVPVRVRARTNTARSAAKFVEAKLGVGLCLDSTVAEGLEDGRLVPLLEQYSAYDRSVYAVYPTTKHLSTRVRRFVDFLLDYFKAAR